GAAPAPATPAKAEAAPAPVKTAETGAKVEPVAVAAAPDKLAQREIAQVESLPAAASGAPPVAARTGTPPVEFGAASVLPDRVPYASPAVRRFARELGVDLAQLKGSERGGRISKGDVQRFVKAALAGGVPAASGAPAAAGGGGLNLLPGPKVDFSK